jgi:hypothetical protein
VDDSKKLGPLPIYIFTIGGFSGVLEFRIVRGSGEVHRWGDGKGAGVQGMQWPEGLKGVGVVRVPLV